MSIRKVNLFEFEVLKQNIIKLKISKNVKTKAKKTDIKNIIKKLEKIRTDIITENTELKARVIKIQEFTGLDYQATTCEIDFPNLDLDLSNERINTFKWMDAIEQLQSDRYKLYLTNILKLDTFQIFRLHDPTGDDSFLNINTNILPIKLSETIDLIIVDRYSITS
ncbi:hypothetical protein C1645_814047 [Glomus cerebriforme]|uniref:Uncharacterized protein n=1 Tax=Glomus cerebriforme TaxID=658196 RepID=A0A397TLX4_9GLOM|nr:hypothetical protein C1645_814047 [Glomus cerebriforme]